jgi:biopolymer transport protein ExbD
VSEDSVRINRLVVARGEVTSRLHPLVRESQDRLVVVSCADAVSYGAFVDVLDQTKLAGASEIAVTGR